MIKLRDAKISDSLPRIVTQEAWCAAFAYALQRQHRKLLYYAERARVYSRIDALEERLLDVLAAELRAPKYEEGYPVEVKRSIVKGALIYYATAGTTAALEQVCRDIFGSAEVVEWYEYGGEPGYFRIHTENAGITDETVREFIAVAQTVKRLSAWLDKLEIVVTAKQELFAGATLLQRVVQHFGNREVRPSQGGEY